MQVQLRTVLTLEIHGVNYTFRPGDWVNIGRQTAERWFAEGIAWSPQYQPTSALPADCALVASAPYTLPTEYDIPVSVNSDYALDAHHVLFLDVSVPFRTALLIPGFRLLEVWEIAVPLCEYSLLAAHIGSHAERELTQTVIHDLRVPVYDSRLMFVRRCERTQLLLEQWKLEWESGGNVRLAFLRALYVVKPLIYALPYTWLTVDGADGLAE